MKKQVAVLISGSGSNLQALIDACAEPDYPAQIALVLSNKADAFGLQRAQKAGIATATVSHQDFTSREEFDMAMHQHLLEHKIDIVCLAGFMRILSPEFVQKWHGNMLNIHPSLLPDFKGAHAHRDVLAAGTTKSGCTVHFVVPEMDAGPIIVQASVPVKTDDTEETLGARILKEEHKCYPLALAKLATGKISIDNPQ